jgi:3-hydroxyisobutyrate dehydrogenase
VTAVAKIGFVGLGDMGGAMVRRIIDAGWPTVLWARRPAALEPFAETGVTFAPSLAALAEQVDLIGICVWSDDDVREIVTGEHGILAGCRPGTIVAIHSTVSPATCRELAEFARTSGVELLDAPVTGGRTVALVGGLTTAVGGASATVTRCRPVFEAFAETVIHVGEVGSGQHAKLLNNALLAANIALADDALTMGIRMGLDETALLAVLQSGSGRSFALDVAVNIRRSAATREAALPALQKDVESLVREVGADEEAGHLIRDVAAITIDRLTNPPIGWGERS